MNPESLDLSIQSALSALFPPFEVTAPVVLSQLFRTIDERYHSDALQCLLDFLIPSKHLLESVQQAACAGYSDVVFRCEGWPLCLHDKTVVQLAPVNPLLLRPGDFYLQVEPFGEQAARIVLKSLLEVGCREVEETPIPETSYPCMFSEEWLQDINEGRHGTPLSRCLLCTDQGVIKLPWASIAIPEFLERPKITPTIRETHPEPKQNSVPLDLTSSTLPVKSVVYPGKDKMSASLRPADSKLVKTEHERRASKSCSKPLIKPVGWVSPNTCDSQSYQEIEGDYVDLVEIGKGREFVNNQRHSHLNQHDSPIFNPVRLPPTMPPGNITPCALTLQYKEPCTPCSQRKLGQVLMDQDLKCRYRESYLAALKNPVPFERGNVNLTALEEEQLKPDNQTATQNVQQGNFCESCMKLLMGNQPCQFQPGCQPTTEEFAPHHCVCFKPESDIQGTPGILKSLPILSQNQGVQANQTSKQFGHTAYVPSLSNISLATQSSDMQPQQKEEAVKLSAKHKIKVRSLSTLSETPLGSPPLYKLNNRSLSDVCPEAITGMIRLKKGALSDQETLKLETMKCYKNDSHSSRGETSSIREESVFKLYRISTGTSSSPPVEVPLTNPDNQKPPQSEKGRLRKNISLLELGIICVPGSRDRTGRAVVEVYGDKKEWMSPIVSAETICELLLYLHSIPREDVRELGMTVVINAKKKPPPLHLYKALLMAQEQALHAVHSILILVDKDTSPRPEKQPGLQMDTVTSMKNLNKTVEASQLTSSLGGTFTYSHTDWLQFHQRLVPFMDDLRGADGLLQKAIKKIDCRNQMDTAQEVQQCIQERRVSMKEVLEDERLVTLQREGGALLARIRREEFRFPQSEDYRDSVDSVTRLYNQVEEKLHTLVMKSNECLQHLDLLFRLREMEAKMSLIGMWFSTEGEERLKDSYTTEEDQLFPKNALKHFHLFLTESKDKQHYALALVSAAEKIVKASDSSPAIDVFRTLVSTFKSNVEDFILRAEQRYKELETLVDMNSFCDKAFALTEECGRFLEQVEPECFSAQTQSTLQMYKKRMGSDFSSQHFQALKDKVCSVGSGATGVMRVWNAALVRCQQVRKRLEEMQKKKSVDKNQIQHPTAAHSPGEVGELERRRKKSDVGEVKTSLLHKPGSPTEVIHAEESREKNSVVCFNHLGSEFKGSQNKDAELKQLPIKPFKNNLPQNSKYHLENKWRSREHHSEADLTSISSKDDGKCFPSHNPLGRSLSEGSYSCSHLTNLSSLLPHNVSQKHCQSRTQPLELKLHLIQNQPTFHNDGLWKQIFQSTPPKTAANKVQDERCQISLQSHEDLRPPGTEINGSNGLRVERIMEELLSTEREYVKALDYVREHYFPELERTDVPQDLRGQRGSIFGNLEKLHDFHRHHFLDELESCKNEPFRVGRCFLRHRESFALYALYSKNKPQSDSLLINHGQTFFKQKQQKLGDKMDLWSYLLKPVQRISKYSLLLQDLIRECDLTQSREVAEAKAALEVIHFQLRHGNNLLAMDAILHCDLKISQPCQ
ncbi:quattro isoform X2 [Gouania willdenowi]|uniref:quattro isoform X2 n=1 Tax=Gouania willdenowi TaxID=441366 RepID=UPI0010564066|nr:uncharacterized protein KIAA1755-like isoform X2 [Gouania willdenowi]